MHQTMPKSNSLDQNINGIFYFIYHVGLDSLNLSIADHKMFKV